MPSFTVSTAMISSGISLRKSLVVGSMGILGYSDDNLLIAPSRSTLQNMLSVCEEYTKEHNLRLSTDKNPTKCKTKCLKFLHKGRYVKPLDLCGNPLPWVDGAKHLGNYVENKIDGLKKDMKIKRADYINKNNDILLSQSSN